MGNAERGREAAGLTPWLAIQPRLPFFLAFLAWATDLPEPIPIFLTRLRPRVGPPALI